MKRLIPLITAACLAAPAAAQDVVLETKGYVLAVHPVQVSPRVVGKVMWVNPHLEEGQSFKEGDVLAKIEDTEYRCDVDHATHMYEAAQARLKEAQGAASEKERQAEAEMAAAKADLDKAKWRLDGCEIRAPIGGTVLTVKAHQGDLVNAAAFNVASSLCDMADLADLEVDVKIPEGDIAKVSAGQACTIMPEAYRNDRGFLKLHPTGYEGRVSRVLPVADRSQADIPVRVRIDVPRDEAGAFLRIDMGVVVSFLKPKKA
jgi:multidrug resistance efflux pump